MLNRPTQNGMTLQEKLEQLQQASGANSFASFADIIGVNVQTLRRVGGKGEGSDRVIKRIADRFVSLTTDMLLDPEKPLPSNLRMTEARKPLADNGLPTEGEQLRRYLYNRNIKPSHLAELMGVSRPQVHYYMKTTKFEKPSREAILFALKAKDTDVFVDTLLLGFNNQQPAVKLDAVLMLYAKDRVTELSHLEDEIQAFSKIISPDRSFYINSKLMETQSSDLARSIAIQITQADRLTPTFQPGSVVLAQQIDRLDWWTVSSSSIALLIGGKIQIRRLLRNDLRGSSNLEVGYFDPQQGSSLFIALDDIQAMFSITHILLSPI